MVDDIVKTKVLIVSSKRDAPLGGVAAWTRHVPQHLRARHAPLRNVVYDRLVLSFGLTDSLRACQTTIVEASIWHTS